MTVWFYYRTLENRMIFFINGFGLLSLLPHCRNLLTHNTWTVWIRLWDTHPPKHPRRHQPTPPHLSTNLETKTMTHKRTIPRNVEQCIVHKHDKCYRFTGDVQETFDSGKHFLKWHDIRTCWMHHTDGSFLLRFRYSVWMIDVYVSFCTARMLLNTRIVHKTW